MEIKMPELKMPSLFNARDTLVAEFFMYEVDSYRKREKYDCFRSMAAAKHPDIIEAYKKLNPDRGDRVVGFERTVSKLSPKLIPARVFLYLERYSGSQTD